VRRSRDWCCSEGESTSLREALHWQDTRLGEPAGTRQSWRAPGAEGQLRPTCALGGVRADPAGGEFITALGGEITGDEEEGVGASATGTVKESRARSVRLLSDIHHGIRLPSDTSDIVYLCGRPQNVP
jgi:hypothetical protein